MTNTVLIHGALGAADQLQPLRDALGGDTSVLELQGHGKTAISHDRYSVERFAAALRAFLHDKPNATVFGYSMGGYVALLLAAEAPDLMGRVITLGTKLAWTPEVAAKEVGRLDPVKIREKVPKFAEQLEARHRGAGGWEAVLARTAALMKSLGDRPLVDPDLLKRITCPVRLMVGDKDAVVSVAETTDAARHLGHGELVVLPDTPHPIEQVQLPLLTAQILRA